MYPWAEWLDGRVWLVRIDKDFSCLSESLRSQAHSWGRLLGVLVATRGLDGGVLIQAYPTTSTWRPNLSALKLPTQRAYVDNPR